MKQLVREFRAIPVTQPIGTFYVTSMTSDVLFSIAHADVRRFEKSGTAVEQYVGIQRRLDVKRAKDIAQYVKEGDATFPTSIVIALGDERCLEFNDETGMLSFFSVPADEDGRPAIDGDDIATILDGQHRLAGLQAGDKVFELPVTVFPAIDIAEQAYVFATINLAQTKVNTSLAYDLLAYARSRSPERTCHDIAVALNDAEGSPFRDKIKRLGSKTPGIEGETLSQATFVQALLHYISREPRRDREDLRNGIPIPLVTDATKFQQTPLRNLFIEEKDEAIVDILWDYFDSIRTRWKEAWDSDSPGQIIKRTNGFRAFMNVFAQAFLAVGGSNKYQPNADDYAEIWRHSNLEDKTFIKDLIVPGTTGERNLTIRLQSAVGVYLMQKRSAPVSS
ncbi:MAG TPA: DGQHR domain-containing protein [Candidatus Elarobacter sp.]|nr:DGQHR domain-containing protein [Candidatus Elarobacter sp.]